MRGRNPTPFRQRPFRHHQHHEVVVLQQRHLHGDRGERDPLTGQPLSTVQNTKGLLERHGPLLRLEPADQRVYRHPQQ